jgi:hypothetical protein
MDVPSGLLSAVVKIPILLPDVLGALGGPIDGPWRSTFCPMQGGLAQSIGRQVRTHAVEFRKPLGSWDHFPCIVDHLEVQCD